MTLTDFYGVIREAVRFAPNEENVYDTLRTFAVLRHPSELNGETVDKSILHKGTKFFWSKKWEQLGYSSNNISWDFPIVTVIPVRSNYTNISGQKSTESVVLDISVLYPNPEIESLSGSHLVRGKTLTREELYDKMKDRLLYILSYIKTAQKATIDGVTDWHGEPYVTYLQGEGATVSVDTKATGDLRRRLHNANLVNNGSFIDDVSAHRLIGHGIAYNLPASSCLPSIAPDFSTVDCCNQVNG